MVIHKVISKSFLVNLLHRIVANLQQHRWRSGVIHWNNTW